MLIYIDRTALFIICIYFFYYNNYYYCYLFLVCVVHYMCLCCSIDLVSICANKEIYIDSVVAHTVCKPVGRIVENCMTNGLAIDVINQLEEEEVILGTVMIIFSAISRR